MPVLRRILLAALVAGSLAGLVVSLAQQLEATLLVRLATSDADEAAIEAQVLRHGPAGLYAASVLAGQRQPQGRGNRTLIVVLANILSGVGFALVLTAGFALLGGKPDWRRGLLWGMGGFAVFTVAPSLGLPPVPPDAAGPDLVLRHLWWLGTVASTAVGLGLAVFTARFAQRLAGLVLLVLPHWVGAPATGAAAVVPPDLAADFVIAALATSLVFWLVLGGLAAHLFQRLEQRT